MLVLRQMHGLIDANADIEAFAVATNARAAERRSAEIVEPDRDPQICVGGTHAVGGVECDPAEPVDSVEHAAAISRALFVAVDAGINAGDGTVTRGKSPAGERTGEP